MFVLPEKSDAGFTVVNPAYGDRRSPYFDLCNCTLWSYMYNDPVHPQQITSRIQPAKLIRSVCNGLVRPYLTDRL
ncbi:hypothetical protein [Nostoc sp.]|uniref:hypothetical protein n=1 Tax=Nostoc sp. TaxID=1180 RepID=UPI002FF2BEFA